MPDKIPFTVYSTLLPRCSSERVLRNRGLCVVKMTASYKLVQPNVKIEERHYTDESGRKLVRTIYTTPYGDLSTLHEPKGFTSWCHEHMFKSPDDYKALLFYIQDTVVEPDYENAAKMVEDLGGDFAVRDQLPLEPLQIFISCHYMNMQEFCMQWMDNQDEILKLYEAQSQLARKIYPVVADGPLEFCNYGGNVVPQIIGVDSFKKYFIPHYNEAAAVLHKKGKLIGSHFDDDNTMIMDAIGETDLDYIEAYDPGISPPVAEARKVWPDKVLWLNYPSAWHVNPVEEVYTGALKLIKEADPCNGFLIGITEDVPENRWRENFMAIMDAINSTPH